MTRTATLCGRVALAATLTGGLLAAPAVRAHHGWSWAESEHTELTGTIRDLHIGPPHPVLTVETEDRGTWTVELGNPRLTERSGFTAASAAVGDRVVALGNRSSDAQERRLKAVRITVGGKTYNIYPDRIPQD